MYSSLKSWWSEQRIMWYERAAECSDFHRKLAMMISNEISFDENVSEAGCGLGYLSNELSSIGYNMSAYDVDERVISRAKEKFKKNIFYIRDCYLDPISADVLIACFFGRITENNNFGLLTKNIRKSLVYIVPEDKAGFVDNFLKENVFFYSSKKLELSFDQPLYSDEVEPFLSSYYRQDKREEKRKMLVASTGEYPFILKNTKKIKIFNIDMNRSNEL